MNQGFLCYGIFNMMLSNVTPAKARVQTLSLQMQGTRNIRNWVPVFTGNPWIPACAGMTPESHEGPVYYPVKKINQR
jgi:hypothetical protein